jgi:hypothetical protein
MTGYKKTEKNEKYIFFWCKLNSMDIKDEKEYFY